MEKKTIPNEAKICLITLFIADPCVTTLSGIAFIPHVVASIFPTPRPALRRQLSIKIVQNDVDNVLNPSANVKPPRMTKPTGMTYLGPFLSKSFPPNVINTPLIKAAGKNNNPVSISLNPYTFCSSKGSKKIPENSPIDAVAVTMIDTEYVGILKMDKSSNGIFCLFSYFTNKTMEITPNTSNDTLNGDRSKATVEPRPRA